MTAARGGERVEERKEECPPACLHLNPFKEIKGFQSSFFLFFPLLCLSVCQQSDCRPRGLESSLGLTALIAGGVTDFLVFPFFEDSRRVFVILPKDALSSEEWNRTWSHQVVACTSSNIRERRSEAALVSCCQRPVFLLWHWKEMPYASLGVNASDRWATESATSMEGTEKLKNTDFASFPCTFRICSLFLLGKHPQVNESKFCHLPKEGFSCGAAKTCMAFRSKYW